MPIIYYVCNACNLYHSGKVRPNTCERCGASDLEKVEIKDKDFNLVMRIVQNIRKRGKNSSS